MKGFENGLLYKRGGLLCFVTKEKITTADLWMKSIRTKYQSIKAIKQPVCSSSNPRPFTQCAPV